jgi:hypothetical protein
VCLRPRVSLRNRRQIVETRFRLTGKRLR